MMRIFICIFLMLLFRHNASAQWSLTGNGSTTPGTNFVGTTDPQHLVFKTNGSEVFRALTNGNVLVGTATDAGHKLQVNGGIYSNTGSFLTGNNRIYEFTSTIGTFKIDGSGGGSGELAFRYGGGGGWYYAFYTGTGHAVSIRDQGLSINRNDNGPTGLTDLIVRNASSNTTATIDVINASNVSLFRIKPDGKTGIGITTPTAQLHTTGSVRLAGLTIDNSQTRVIVSDINGNLAFRDAATLGGSPSTVWTQGGNAVGAETAIGTTTNKALPFITNNEERMRIGTNGNIGIGTIGINDPGYKLYVETGIRTRKVRVDPGNWADYVFHPGYSLRSLAEVEQYIKDHNHLPEVASAAEVQKEGVDLGDNQVVLLKKIEELTLYIIDQNKKMNQLQEKIGYQQTIQQQQQERIEKLEKHQANKMITRKSI